MNVGNSIRKSILDWEQGELESAMLHACNAIDGTARKRFPKLGSKARFIKLLRENYDVLGPMGAPGINLVETVFPVELHNPTGPDGYPDIADVIYGVHRCTHGHGDELPNGFELIPDTAGPSGLTHMEISKGKVRLSDRCIFGLIAVAVFASENLGQTVPEGFHLTYGKVAKLLINEWWGKKSEFASIVALEPMPSVKFDFSEWMKNFSAEIDGIKPL